MALTYILSNLLADVPRAEAVIFLDSEGETIEVLSARMQPYDIKVQGAYEVIHHNQLSRKHLGTDWYYVLGTQFSVFTILVGKEYYLVVITQGEALPGRVLRCLKRARRDLEEQVL